MRTLNLELEPHPYPIYIGADLLREPELLLPHLAQKWVAVVSNVTVAPLYIERLKLSIENAGVAVVEILLPDGEIYKTWESLNSIYDALIHHRCERKTTVLALGGGVVGDMAGFAAATYMRGVPYIQIPTTLLAQVDSSVGGKTGINHPLGKNMIGAFHQPQAVIIDTDVLQTLPERELSAGLAEVIKYGLIRDLPFFEWLETNMEHLRARNPEALTHAIYESCRNKAEVVAEDERETGVRALLNLGHTFGHAIETGVGYGKWLHGEAVAAGTMLAADLSRRMGWLDAATVERIADLYRRAGLPVEAPDLGVQRYIDLMGADKKVEAGKLRFVLLEKLGQAVLTDKATPSNLADTLSHQPTPQR